MTGWHDGPELLVLIDDELVPLNACIWVLRRGCGCLVGVRRANVDVPAAQAAWRTFFEGTKRVNREVEYAGRQSQFAFDKLCGLYHDRRYPERIARDWQAMGRMTLDELHTRQIGWYREQAEGLAAYWLREAQQKAADADLDVPPANGDLSADERRTLLRREANEPVERAADISLDWPLRPLVVA